MRLFGFGEYDWNVEKVRRESRLVEISHLKTELQLETRCAHYTVAFTGSTITDNARRLSEEDLLILVSSGWIDNVVFGGSCERLGDVFEGSFHID